MDLKKIEKIIELRMGKNLISQTREKTRIFLEQSLSRFNAVSPRTDYSEVDFPEKIMDIVIKGMEILYMKLIVFEELNKRGTDQFSESIAALVAVLNNLESCYFQDIQLIKGED